MKAAFAILAAVLCLAAAHPAAAQRSAQPAAANWVSAWLGGYYDLGNVADDAGEWRFGSGFALGGGLHRDVGPGLALGVEGSIARVPYEVHPTIGTVVRGDATLVTSMASGRLRYGGGEQLAIQLTGGIGAFTYFLSEIDRVDPDFALLTGGGVDYQLNRRTAAFVQWGRYWVFHPRAGINTHRANHHHLRGGVRLGW
jgi:hypothetical protein